MLGRLKNTFSRDRSIDHPVSTVPRTGRGNAVEATGMSVVYGRVPVLCDIELAVAQGESIAVTGPNGAGKSTLLKCLVGVVRPAAGRVCWFGEATTRRDYVCRQIGFVGQECGLYAELTALENLMFAGRMNGIASTHDRARALLTDGGLELQAHRPAGQLSQGMRQRLSIVRALVHEPRLVVLDEPSSSLDEAGRQWLTRLFRRWRSAGKTVCFATHDATLARNLSDRVIHVDAGRIVEIERLNGPPATWQRSA